MSGLAKLTPMAYFGDVHGRAAEVYAFDSRGTMVVRSVERSADRQVRCATRLGLGQVLV